MRKALQTSTIALLLIFVFTSFALAEYWGTKNSNKYHYPTCVWAQKIKPANLVKFKSPEEAKKAGYVPCKVCKPPLSGTAQAGVSLAKFNEADPERRGCCSWHGGVCGCDDASGRVLCCDGTLSPTCTCN